MKITELYSITSSFVLILKVDFYGLKMLLNLSAMKRRTKCKHVDQLVFSNTKTNESKHEILIKVFIKNLKKYLFFIN